MDAYRAGGLKHSDKVLPSLQLLSVESSGTGWGQLDLLVYSPVKNKGNKNAPVQ